MVKLFQPVRMESMYLSSSLKTAFFRNEGELAPIDDGSIVVLTNDFFVDPVYSNSFTRASGEDVVVTDFNSHYVQYPFAATAENVWLVDIADVPSATVGGNVYRMGIRTTNLVRAAGKQVRVRRNVLNDTFLVGAGNFTAAPTVNQYAILTANSGQFTPSATAPTDGAYWVVSAKTNISEGLEPSDAYRLMTLRN